MELKVLTMENEEVVRNMRVDHYWISSYQYLHDGKIYNVSNGKENNEPELRERLNATPTKKLGCVAEETLNGCIIYGVCRYNYNHVYDFRIAEVGIVENGSFRQRGHVGEVPERYSFLTEEKGGEAATYLRKDEFGRRSVGNAIEKVTNGGDYHWEGDVHGTWVPGEAALLFDILTHNELLKWELPKEKLEEKLRGSIYDKISRFCHVVIDGYDVVLRLYLRREVFYGLFEYMRIRIDKDNKVSVYSNLGIGWVEINPKDVFWSDIYGVVLYNADSGVENTAFRHYGKYLTKRDYGDSGSLFYMQKALTAILFPALDNLYQIDEKDAFGFISSLTPGWHTTSSHIRISELLEVHMGKCDFEARSFAKMIGLAQWQADYLMENLSRIVVEKYIIRFKDFVGEEYLRHMDRHTFERYVSCLTNRKQYYTFQLLMENYGREHLQSYIRIIDSLDDVSLRYYEDYLKMALELREEYPEFSWNINTAQENILERHEDILYVYNTSKSNKEAERFRESFDKQKAKWDKYEYKGIELSVISPKSPNEITMEGIALHHCVKSYLTSICKGETVIMFIRKNDIPHKPFYTLEIKDGSIRQCHGFGNCNVTPEIETLLKEYCRDKKLKYVNPNMVLAAG